MLLEPGGARRIRMLGRAVAGLALAVAGRQPQPLPTLVQKIISSVSAENDRMFYAYMIKDDRRFTGRHGVPASAPRGCWKGSRAVPDTALSPSRAGPISECRESREPARQGILRGTWAPRFHVSGEIF